MDTSDPRFAELESIFLGNQHAIDLFAAWVKITEVWDDLIDGDRPVSKAQIHSAFCAALVGLPANPLYQSHGAVIRAAMAGAIVAWMNSDEMRANPAGAEDVITAHVVRYQVVDVAILLLAELFGFQHAAAHAPAIRRMFRCESLNEFLEN